MVERRIRIINQLGLHARAAGKLVRLASKFSSDVTLAVDGTTANARSILDLLTLGAGYGTFVDIRVEGSDEDAAIAEIEELFKNGFGEI